MLPLALAGSGQPDQGIGLPIYLRAAARMRGSDGSQSSYLSAAARAAEGADLPTSFPGRSQLFRDDEWINSGDAIIVESGGRLVAGPHRDAKSTLYASVDPEAARSERKSLDPAGHYGRPDLFELRFDRGRHTPVVFSDHG